MIISNNKTIEQIQQEFSQLYPGLKIELYSGQHDVHKASPKSQLIDPHVKIGDIRSSSKEGDLTVTSDLTVAEVEQALKVKFGLNAQVFRKSGNIWLQTSTTDDWTLEKQNGKALRSIEAAMSLYDKS